MTQRKPRHEMSRGKPRLTNPFLKRRFNNCQLDSHCWRFYFIKHRADYNSQNRERIANSKINL